VKTQAPCLIGHRPPTIADSVAVGVTPLSPPKKKIGSAEMLHEKWLSAILARGTWQFEE
jgi:hypothetical protein